MWTIKLGQAVNLKNNKPLRDYVWVISSILVKAIDKRDCPKEEWTATNELFSGVWWRSVSEKS